MEAEIVASGSVKKVLKGKHYNRAMRMYHIVYEALWRFRWVVIGKQLTLQNASDVNRERAVNLVKAMKDDPSQENFSKHLAHEDIHTLFTYKLSFSEGELWDPWQYFGVHTAEWLTCYSLFYSFNKRRYLGPPSSLHT